MTYPPYQSTGADRDEMIEAIVERYKQGQLGPIAVIAELLIYRVPQSEAEKIRDEFREVNAANRAGFWR